MISGNACMVCSVGIWQTQKQRERATGNHTQQTAGNKTRAADPQRVNGSFVLFHSAPLPHRKGTSGGSCACHDIKCSCACACVTLRHCKGCCCRSERAKNGLSGAVMLHPFPARKMFVLCAEKTVAPLVCVKNSLFPRVKTQTIAGNQYRCFLRPFLNPFCAFCSASRVFLISRSLWSRLFMYRCISLGSLAR